MEYPASKTRTLNIAFVVNADLLKRLAQILGETSDNLEYTVKFSDGTSIRYNEIEEVIRQPNSSKRSIVSLIAGPAGQTAKSAYMNLRKSDWSSLEYTINGTHPDVIYLADKLDDWVTTVRQWYSPLFSGDNLILYLLGAGFPLVVFYYTAYRIALHPFVSVGTGLALVIIAVVAVVIGEFYALKLFPHGTFAIGHGEKRHQVFTYLRNGVLVGLGLSVMGGVIANWITRRP